MKKQYLLAIYILIYQLFNFLIFSQQRDNLMTVYYGLDLKGMPLVIFSGVLFACFETLVILVPIKDIWDDEVMIRVRTTKFQFYKVTYFYVLPMVIFLLITNVVIGGYLGQRHLVLGNFKIFIVSSLCICLAIRLKEDKRLFAILLGIILVSRYLFTTVLN